jgi:hypothetical protein
VDRLAGGDVRLHSAIPEPACREVGAGPRGWRPAWIAALGFQETLRPPSGARWGLRGSYDGEFTGLGSRWSAAFTAAAWSRLGTPDGLRLLQVGGVSHVLRVASSPLPGLELVQTLPSPYVCPLQVHRVPDPLPVVYVVRGERVGGDPEAALRAVLDPSFDPRREVVLTEASAAAFPVLGPDTARVVSRRADALEVEAQLCAPGVLVVLEAFEAGWRATVDGAPAPVLRANGLFRAVRLPGGRHRVRFVYRPPSAAAGAALSLLGVVAAAALGLGARLRGRRPEGSIPPGGAS